MHMTEIWRHALDKGKVVGVLFIDFKKAFDSINHKILYKKLQGVGIADQMLDIISDYLENRLQYVELDGSKSSSRIITYGVPQGSLLGPRLFSIYINDLADNILKGNLYLFADDSTLYCIGDNIEGVIDSLNEAASEVNRWCNHNQLSIHPGKSEVLIITSQQFTGPLRPVKIGTDTIRFVDKSTSLGITIDNHLKWDEQIKKVTKAFCAKVGQLRRMSYLPVNVQEEIYFKNIIAAVTYGLTVWGTCTPSQMKDIEKIHLRAARIIYKIPKTTPENEVLLTANWDEIDYIYKRKILVLMHKAFYNSLPETLEMHFKPLRTRSRDSHKFEIPRCSKEIGRVSIRHRGPLLWNNLPLELRKVDNLDTFKTSIKREKKLIKSISFLKEASVIMSKHPDFIYF